VAGSRQPVAEDFAEWLISHEVKHPIGLVGCSLSCPLSAYLSHVTGHTVAVYGSRWKTIPNGTEQVLPRWASQFVYMVDDGWLFLDLDYPTDSHRPGVWMNAGTALELLTEAMKNE